MGGRFSQLLFAPLVTFAAVGLLSLLSPLIPWNPAHLALEVGVIVAVLLVIRFVRDRSRFLFNLRSQGKEIARSFCAVQKSHIIGASLGILFNAIFVFAIVVGSVESPSSIIQAYDNPFHGSVVRQIVETYNESPLGAGSVMGSEGAIYPDLWHSLVALSVQVFGVDMQEGVWVITLAVLAFIMPLGMCLLVRQLFPRATGWMFFLAAAATMLVPRSAFTYVTFGSLYANLLGLTILPSAIALAVSVLRGCSFKHDFRKIITALLISVLALGFSHPSTVFIMGMFVVPLLVAQSKTWLGRIAVSLGACIVWLVLMKSSFFFRTINCLDRVVYSSEMGERWLSAVGFDYTFLAKLDFLVVFVMLAMIGISILVAFLIRKKWRSSWYLVSLGMVASLVIASLFPDNWFSVIATGFWYRDVVRLFVVLFVFMLPLLIGVCSLVVSLLRRISSRSTRMIVNGGFASVCVLMLFTMVVYKTSHYQEPLGALTSLPRSSDDSTVLTSEQAEFLETVAAVVGDDVVLNNYQDASVWLYPVYGVDALVKGRAANQMSSMSDDLFTVVTGIACYGGAGEAADEVQQAAKRLNLSYVVQLSNGENLTTRFNDLDQILYDTAGPKSTLRENTPGFELVVQQGDMKLFRLIDTTS